MPRVKLVALKSSTSGKKVVVMQEINPIKNKIADLKSRGLSLRGYL
jgi:hypothetical protein